MRKKPAQKTRSSTQGVAGADAASRHARTRAAHALERAEDYVELIDELVRRRGAARVVELAKAMGVSHVTVVRAIARMQRQGLVRTEPYRAIELTPAGRKLAAGARRRHEVVVEFLVRIGVPRDVAEIDAEGIEHHVSPETLRAFERAGGR
ncbi:MAG: manganese-binding transcriptional regulator MntR [Phycisphaerales bacterium]|nr:manganese-binding transcriptional regulator MntR [Phycisphaerales bacterium]